MFVKAPRCLAKALTTGVPGGVNGALKRSAVILCVVIGGYYLQHVAQDTKDAVESLVILRTIALFRIGFPSDTCHHFSNDDQVDDQWRRQKRVLADIEQTNGLVTTQEDLRIVFIKGTFVIPYSRHILNDYTMIGMLSRFVENVVRLHHIINDIRLGYLFRAKLLLRAQIHTIIVSEMVVAGHGRELDSGIDHEVHQGGLHLRLPGLEIVTTNEGAVLLCKLHGSWNEGVLGRSIDERGVLKNTSNGKDG